MSEVVISTDQINIDIEQQDYTLTFDVVEIPQILVLDAEDTPTVVITQPSETHLVIGSAGPQGAPGRGIVSINRTSGGGLPGETDTYTITYSDGTSSTFEVYNGSDGSSDGGASLAAHITDETPHPAYDDMVSLVLRFENGLV